MVDCNFESERKMEDIVIEYVSGEIKNHVNHIQYMMNNIISFPLNTSFR